MLAGQRQRRIAGNAHIGWRIRHIPAADDFE
jgi:hypothetical protein